MKRIDSTGKDFSERMTNGKQRRPANAADILGRMPPRGTSRANRPFPAKWTPYYEKLMELRQKLLAQIGEHRESSHLTSQPFSMHMADSGTDSIDRDFTLSLLQSEKNALYEIDQAILRMREGTYGICEMTGEPISSERLRAIPWSRYSLKAQRQLERTGAVPHPHLSQLGSLQGYQVDHPQVQESTDEQEEAEAA